MGTRIPRRAGRNEIGLVESTIPPWNAADEDKVLKLAFQKIAGEKNTLRDLQAGESLGSVFAKYGIL